jgi:prepilin-type N-terminal cleavage/methylation domain-containing protein
MHIVTAKERGFSLVELAIVLVIVGLLAGGIMGGSHIMHTSQLQQVGTEIDRYKMGIRTFEQKYGALPGDFDTAFDLWGTAGGCTDNDVTGNPAGCNGNGDGVIAWDTEGYRGWQHLGLAEILTDDFSGTSTGNEAAQQGCSHPNGVILASHGSHTDKERILDDGCGHADEQRNP